MSQGWLFIFLPKHFRQKKWKAVQRLFCSKQFCCQTSQSDDVFFRNFCCPIKKLKLDFSGWPEAETKGERSGRRGELWQLVVGPVPGLAVERSRISLDLQTRRGRIVKGERFIWNMWSMIVTGEATNQEMSVPDCIYRLLLKSSRFRPCLWPGYILMQQNTACWRQQLAGMGIHGIRDPRKIHKGWSGALKKNVYKNLHISLFYLISFVSSNYYKIKTVDFSVIWTQIAIDHSGPYRC